MSPVISFGRVPTPSRPQQIRDIHATLFQNWPTILDAVPTLKHHWVNASCLLGDPPTLTASRSIQWNFPSNMSRYMAHHLRRCTNIETSLDECLLFAGRSSNSDRLTFHAVEFSLQSYVTIIDKLWLFIQEG